MQRQLSTPEMAVFPREEEEEEEEDDLEAKPEKAPAIRSSWERYIHLILVLAVLCYVVLFLCSNASSASDMSSFGGKAAESGNPKSL